MMARPLNPITQKERREQILQAARTVFAQRGLAEARMDDIAQVSGLGKGTLYLYYKTKDDLVVGLLEAL
ncbi:MAG: TetR/AcrR family transcriptional regulator, partial [Anaerolineae bacterium]|nr:TetR/AcrR family transcriptional regulator [Anaerolineae bacterium]